MESYLIPPSRSTISGDRLDAKSSENRSAPSFRVLYDADCGLCSRCVRFLATQPSVIPLQWLPIASGAAHELVPDRPADEMGLVGPRGEVWFGGDAWIMCLWALPRYRRLARLMALRPLRPLVHLGYRLVARNRQYISRLLGGSCRIP